MTRESLKIGFVLDDGLDRPDGVQQYVLTLGSWLSSMGHNVHYLAGHTTRSDIANVHSLARNVRVKFNGNTLSIPLPASGQRIKKLLGELDLDVMHVQVPHSPFFGAKVVKRSNARTFVIGTFHVFPYNRLASVGTKILGWHLQSNLKRFDRQLSVSSAAQSFAKSTFRLDTTVVPNMVNTSFYAPVKKPKPISSGALNIVFLGRLVRRKGCHLLLKALMDIRNQNPNLKFHLNICGKGEMLHNLQKIIKDNSLENNITFLGFVSEEHKVKVLQSADVAIFPSYAGESFGIVLIEAMAAGSGVVVGGINPGYSSVLGEVPESLIDVINRKEFCEKLGNIMTDTKLRQEIHDKQQMLVKRYDVETVGSAVLRAYTEGIESKRALIRSS